MEALQLTVELQTKLVDRCTVYERDKRFCSCLETRSCLTRDTIFAYTGCFALFDAELTLGNRPVSAWFAPERKGRHRRDKLLEYSRRYPLRWMSVADGLLCAATTSSPPSRARRTWKNFLRCVYTRRVSAKRKKYCMTMNDVKTAVLFKIESDVLYFMTYYLC